MKKILSMLFICLLVITIHGCSINGNQTPTQNTKANNAADNLKPQVNQAEKVDISKYKFAVYLVKNLSLSDSIKTDIDNLPFFIDSPRESTTS